MGFSLEEYAKVRPTLWHFTHEMNLPLIRKTRTLVCAAQLVPNGPADCPRRGRAVRDGVPVLRDQDLLHAGSIAFQSGWTMADVVRDLNGRVFFWSGWTDRPVKPGRRAFIRYRTTDIILRVPFRELAQQSPYFSRVNAGATRRQRGEAVPRGPDTFVRAEQSAVRPSAVVEVSFLGSVLLPKSAEVARSFKGPWEGLY